MASSPRIPTRAIRRLAPWAAAAALVATPACETSILLAPSGTAITLTSEATAVAANGSITITAQLLQGVQTTGQNGATSTTAGTGLPVHDGTVVTFSTTIGRMQPSEAKTAEGFATVRLVGDGRTGTATVTASSGSATKTLTITVGGGSTGLSITPPSTTIASVPAQFTVGIGSGGTFTNVVIDFGDGSAPAPLGTLTASQAVQHLFPDGGTYTVSVTATFPDASRNSVSTIVVASPLSANMTASPTAINSGGSSLLTVTTSSGAVIDHYEFDFADGTGFHSFPGNVQSHVFPAKGTFTVQAIVVPVVGVTRLVQVQVVVN